MTLRDFYACSDDIAASPEWEVRRFAVQSDVCLEAFVPDVVEHNAQRYHGIQRLEPSRVGQAMVMAMAMPCMPDDLRACIAQAWSRVQRSTRRSRYHCRRTPQAPLGQCMLDASGKSLAFLWQVDLAKDCCTVISSALVSELVSNPAAEIQVNMQCCAYTGLYRHVRH